MQTPHYLKPNWPQPPNIKAVTVTYPEEFSNIQSDLNLPAPPVFLNQIHSNQCVRVEAEALRNADASVTESLKHPLVIRTADCLPILLCHKKGLEVAAIHAGWRGLSGGIIENTLLKTTHATPEYMAWMGPAICEKCFEVGEDVYHAFTTKYPEAASAFDTANTPKKYLANLKQIATFILKKQGVDRIYDSGACTFEEKNKYYSYRRKQQTGRIVSLIWLT